jgi:hypothetical protein
MGLPVAEFHSHQQTAPDKSCFRQCRLNPFADDHVAQLTRIQARWYQKVRFWHEVDRLTYPEVRGELKRTDSLSLMTAVREKLTLTA